MDPEACLQRLLDSDDDSETIQAAADLLGWLLAGGHTPANWPKLRERVALKLAGCADRAEVQP